MIAVRGHLFNLNEQAGSAQMDYMIYTKVKDADGNTEYVYMFPKGLQVTQTAPLGNVVYGTLGGTFIRDTDMLSQEELDQLDKVEFAKLYERNSNFFWGDSSNR